MAPTIDTMLAAITPAPLGVVVGRDEGLEPPELPPAPPELLPESLEDVVVVVLDPVPLPNGLGGVPDGATVGAGGGSELELVLTPPFGACTTAWPGALGMLDFSPPVTLISVHAPDLPEYSYSLAPELPPP